MLFKENDERADVGTGRSANPRFLSRVFMFSILVQFSVNAWFSIDTDVSLPAFFVDFRTHSVSQSFILGKVVVSEHDECRAE